MTLRSLKDPEDTAAQMALGKSPGMRLAAARAARNLSLEEVADELNLSVSVIAALEADDYANLPGETFVRGYLRGFAHLVDIDESVVLGESPGTPNEVAVTLRDPGRVSLQTRSRSRWGLWASSFAVLVAGAAGISWVAMQPWFDMSSLANWVNGNDGSERIVVSAPTPVETSIQTQPIDPDASNPPATVAFEPTVADTDPIQTGVAQVPASEIGSTDMSVTRSMVVDSRSTDAARTAEPAAARPSFSASEFASATAESATQSTATPPSTADTSGNPSSVTTIPGTELDSTETAEYEQVVASSALPEMPEPLLFSSDRLTIRASGNSWVEIVDVDGKRLLVGMLRSGETRRVEGEAPFAVLLGDATVINMEVNDVAKDIDRFVRSDSSARFTVGE
ncbi:MAG: DUF4115 domain-containing protein [Gammaproteobacteria bacterium]|nr:DUF4115 domain-containing protein [Gammaproteobacteria bacterium]MDH3467378.1 DUF4115 domain-containing protein [Gammaproteobacteria bacterium]